jgi:flagellar motor switch protein FliG
MTLTPTLRKAAILISSLDVRTADALLEQMGPVQAQRVRDAVMELGDVRAEEQERIIAEFVGGQPNLPVADDGIELAGSLAAKLQGATPTARLSEPPRPVKPFAFLQDASSDVIALHLQREHPQTIALVLTHLPPPRAAAVVTNLPGDLQADVLMRVADIEEMHPEIVREVERGLEAALSRELSRTRRRGAGTQALQAILEAAGDSKNRLTDHVVKRDPLLAARIKVELPSPSREFVAPASASTEMPAARIAPQRRTREAAAHMVEFSQLGQLDDLGWARLLQAADTQLALLALAGATPELVERLLAQLPAPEARALERRIEAVGPVRLRDIEHAQQYLARIASQLAARNEIRLPRQRPFATAA